MLEGDTWLANARHANEMARRLYHRINSVPGVRVMHEPQANAVFAFLPPPAIKTLQNEKGWKFYDFIAGGGCRLMCAWDTRVESVDAFADDIAAACAAL
jgi:threonine aldolase